MAKAALPKLAVLLLMFLAVRAHAAPDDAATAKRLYEQGLTEYNLGHYEKALGAFEEGYRLRRDPAFLYNIGQCNRQLRHYEEAERSYRSYLREANLPPRMRDKVEKLIAEAESAAQEQRAKAPVEKAPVATPPPSETPPVVATPSSAPSVTKTAPRRRHNLPAWTIGAAGVVVLAVGGGLLGAAASKGQAANGAATFADQGRLHDEDLSLQRAGWPLVGVGSAACATAVVLFAVRGL